MRVQRETGYTLIEMLVVVGLLALIAAVAAPTFTANDAAILNRSATEVARALRLRTVRQFAPVNPTVSSRARRASLSRSIVSTRP